MEVLTIGGKEVKLRFKEVTCLKILKKFNQVYTYQKKDPKVLEKVNNLKREYDKMRADLKEYHAQNIITDEELKERSRLLYLDEINNTTAMKTMIADKYFYWAAWQLINKKGIWPFKKPFRSMRHMYNEIERGEAFEIIKLIGEKILGYKTNITDTKKKG